MNSICDLAFLPAGKPAAIEGVLSKKEVLLKNDGTNYLLVALCDKSTTIEFPIWNNIDIANEALEVGRAYKVEGTVDFYREKLQIKFPKFYEIKDRDISEFIPSFDISQDDLDEFSGFVDAISDDKYKSFAKACFDKKIGEKTVWELFQIAPAATRHHHNKLGGLFVHTFGMMKLLKATLALYPDSSKINPDRLMVKVMLHDIMKIKEYTYPVIGRTKSKLDHLTLGITFITTVNEEHQILSDEELDNFCYGILSHHGKYGQYEPKTIEDDILHSLDMIDSRMNTESRDE